MTPYYDEDGITIFHGDCREVLPALEAGAVVTDPPYGISLSNNDRDGHRREAPYTIAGDDDDTVAEWVLSWAATRGLPTVAFASPWNPWPGLDRNLIVWDKGGAVGGGGDIATCLKRSWELIQVDRNTAIFGPRCESVWRFPIVPNDTSLHIAQKPVGLMARLLMTFVPESVVSVDPFMGSGSTLVAAKSIGYRAIGIEQHERYCEIAANRLKQGVLFGAT